MKKLILVVALLAAPVAHADTDTDTGLTFTQARCALSGSMATLINKGRVKGDSFEHWVAINHNTEEGHTTSTNRWAEKITYEVYARHISNHRVLSALIQADCLANPEAYK